MDTTTEIADKSALTSLALIKAIWDVEKKDYIENFVPLFGDLIRKYYGVLSKGFDEDIISQFVKSEYGLVIPYHPTSVILNRLRKRGTIYRSEGRLYPDASRIIDSGFSSKARDQERKIDDILTEFQQFARAEYQVDLSTDAANAALIGFLKTYDLEVISSFKSRDMLPDVSPRKEQLVLFAFFVKHAYDTAPRLYEDLVSIAVGYVISSVILNEHLENFRGKLKGKTFYLDTNIILKLLSLETPENAEAYSGLLDLLLSQGASVKCFQHTVDEAQAILEGCRGWLTSSAFNPSRASRVCLNLHDLGYRESDLDHLVATLEKRLEAIGIEISAAPDPNIEHEYQPDESALRAEILAVYAEANRFFDPALKEFTIDRDVKSISAIYKLRRGRRPRLLVDARYTFITANQTLAGVAYQYDKKQYGNHFAIPVCLSDTFVGTILWMNKPTYAVKINRKRLIADCLAAIEPSPALMERFLEVVEALKQRRAITEEEYLVVRSDRVGRELLMQRTLGSMTISDADALDVVDEARKRIAHEEREALENERRLRVQSSERLAQETALAAKRTAQLTTTINRFAAVIGVCAAVVFVIIAGLIHFGESWLVHLRILSPLAAKVLEYVIWGLAVIVGIDALATGRFVKQIIKRWVLREAKSKA